MSREDLLLAEADAIQKRYDRASCQLRQARESLDANSCAALALDERLKLQDALVERGLCASRMAHLRLMCSVAGMPEDKTPFLRIDLVHRTELEVQGLLR
ncbi:hypothetical protein [Caenimonas sp. SL110]|uniref:hypothetical protein n=1 Tax=Caenimonas sp. SL110 TaxID=1450524 RepID=UPI000652F83A|nr:hypothetical protein [Caenimonas sp. SL110]